MSDRISENGPVMRQPRKMMQRFLVDQVKSIYMGSVSQLSQQADNLRSGPGTNIHIALSMTPHVHPAMIMAHIHGMMH